MVKSGLTNDDLIRFCEVFTSNTAILDKMPQPPVGEEPNNWYENSEEYKFWKREYDLEGRKSGAAYLRLRWRIGKRIGAHLIASRNDPFGKAVSMSIHVFPRSQFPTRAIVRKYWQVPFPASRREEFPAGVAFIYFLPA